MKRLQESATGGEAALPAPWVLKLGGSLSAAQELPEWLRACAAMAPRLVLVAGGGPYADAVRHAQARWRFGDAPAHAMALVAMEMFARQCCAMQYGLVPCATLRDMRRVLRRGRTPVWMPLRLALRDDSLDANWNTTSDSLAAWLALHLGAAGLVLVKSAARPPGDWQQVARAGAVDTAFAGHAQALPRVEWLQGGEHRQLLSLLLDAAQPAARPRPALEAGVDV